MSREIENDAIEEAGRWYVEVLEAVGTALAECHIPYLPPEMLVQSLARQGYTIEKEQA